MKLQRLMLADIEPYRNNPRKNDEAVNAVAESIRQCSYITPIIVDDLICDGLTEEQKKKYRFLDNKTGEKATWDLMKLEVELEGLDLEGFDFFGMAADLPVDSDGSGGSKKELTGTTEIDAEVFGDEEFKYECPNCGFRFN